MVEIWDFFSGISPEILVKKHGDMFAVRGKLKEVEGFRCF